MITIGLTGSIGMGKTTAAKMLSVMGCAVHDSDHCVHRALKPHGLAFEEVAVTFPEVWNKKTHTIDRKKLGRLVFSDFEKKQALESILHPIVQQDQRRFLQTQIKADRNFSVLDIPLLFETGADRRVDVTAVVTAPFSMQRRRVLSRDNMSEDKFYSILDAQMLDVHKRALADFIVPTGLGRAYTYKVLQSMLRELR